MWLEVASGKMRDAESNVELKGTKIAYKYYKGPQTKEEMEENNREEETRKILPFVQRGSFIGCGTTLSMYNVSLFCFDDQVEEEFTFIIDFRDIRIGFQ